jgi:lysophospholipase L1-like esterase
VTGFDNQTVRNVLFSSIGGSMVRVRFTNAYGAAPLQIGHATVAIHARGPRVASGTTRVLTFAGHQSVTIPPGAEALSDPVRLTVRAMQELAVSEFLPRPTGPPTEHGGAQQFNYVASGDHAADSGRGGAFKTRMLAWYLVDDVDVVAPARETGTIVAIGDSITDGVGSTVGANARWPNDLARRLQSQSGNTLNVIDEGIGGNRVLNDAPCCGVNAVARFGPDALAHAGVQAVILLEGVNDIGFSQSIGWLTAPHSNVSAAQIIAGYSQMIAQAHTGGIPIFGATLTPFRGARYWTPSGEAKREEVNHWILTSGAFDGVIDFARVVADPNHPDQLAHRYDSGDHLHPNDTGYRAMAAAINLGTLMRATERRGA